MMVYQYIKYKKMKKKYYLNLFIISSYQLSHIFFNELIRLCIVPVLSKIKQITYSINFSNNLRKLNFCIYTLVFLFLHFIKFFLYIKYNTFHI